VNKQKNLFLLSVRRRPKKVPKGNRLPPDVVKHWPEVFNDVEIQTIPIEYLVSVRVEFDDGKIWDIELDKKKQDATREELEESLSTFFEEYSDSITNIDFRLDTKKVINDVKARTRLFMKKRR
jgi:hypothetical protein